MIRMGRYEACFEETGNRRIELGATMPLISIWSILLLALGIYLALGLLLFLFQGRLLYYPNLPSRAIVATPERIGLGTLKAPLTGIDEAEHGTNAVREDEAVGFGQPDPLRG